MKFWQRVRFALSRKESQVQMLLSLQANERPQADPRTFEQLAKEGYMRNVIVYRCVNLIAESVSRMPLVVYRRQRNGKAIEVETHPFYDVMRRPNQVQKTWEDFVGTWVSYLMCSGNAYVELSVSGSPEQPPTTTPPTELTAHSPQWFTLTPGVNGTPAKYTARVQPRERDFPVDRLGRSNIIHDKLWNPLNQWFGLSPLEAAALDVDTLNEAALWNLALLKNGGRPSLAVVCKQDQYSTGKLDPNQRKELKHDLRERIQGGKNAGNVLVLEGGQDVKELSHNPKDMEFPSIKNSGQKDVALIYGVPGQLVGIEGSETYANWEQARLSFYEDTAVPRAERCAARLTTDALSRFPGSERDYIAVDKDRVEALGPRRTAVWDRVQKADYLTIDEKREACEYEQYEPDPENPADRILVSTNLVPLELAATGGMGDDGDTDTSDLNEDESPDEIDEPDEPDDDGDKAAPLVNARTAAQRRAAFRAVNRKRLRHSGRFASEINSLFRLERNELAAAVRVAKATSAAQVESLVDVLQGRTRGRWVSALEKHLRRVGGDFGPEVLRAAKELSLGVETKADRWETAFDSWVKRYAGNRITGIQGTTRKRVIKGLRDAITSAGSEAIELADEIESLYKGFSRGRSMTIARTETHNASTRASLDAAESLSIPGLEKTWNSVKDDRTRGSGANDSADHLVMDGVSVALDAKFLVPGATGDDEMDGPGDGSAPAAQICNCRCILTFGTPKED